VSSDLGQQERDEAKPKAAPIDAATIRAASGRDLSSEEDGLTPGRSLPPANVSAARSELAGAQRAATARKTSTMHVQQPTLTILATRRRDPDPPTQEGGWPPDNFFTDAPESRSI
jgi:hypothetical protein